MSSLGVLFSFSCVALLYFKIAIQHNCKFAQFDLIRIIRDMQYFKAGKLVAVHGLKGELILKHELGKKSSLKDVKAIFIEDKKDSFFPWFIETAKAKSADEVLLKLESIDTREAAAKISQKEIWLTEEDFKNLSAKSAPANLLGYTIINNKDRLSEILEVVEQPHQLLCRIEINKKEVLIPINESFLKNIDHKKKEVIVELPDGLLDIYL
jgi:16S rRNA processing protein RimM